MNKHNKMDGCLNSVKSGAEYVIPPSNLTGCGTGELWIAILKY